MRKSFGFTVFHAHKFSPTDNILPLKCSNAANHFIDLCLVRIKLAQFNAFYCWEGKSFLSVSQTNNQRAAATLHCFKAIDFNSRDAAHWSWKTLLIWYVFNKSYSYIVEIFASNCNNACLEQRFVWCSALCFWHVKFYHIWHNSIFCICFIMQKKESLSRSDVIRKRTKERKCSEEENFHFQVKLLCFQHLRNLFSRGSYLCFPMNSHHNTAPAPFPHPPNIKNTEASGKWIFKMNNKHFHTQNRHLLISTAA